jgi:hypothetical protein
VFLEEVGLLRAFAQISLPGVQRVVVPTVQCVLLSFLKVLVGSESMNELARVLFSDLALMELVGFNAQQCENGLTKRGDAQRKIKKEAGTDHAPMLSGEYQQAEAGRDGTALQSDGATQCGRACSHWHDRERSRTEVVGLEALTSYDSYGAAEATQHAGRRDYVGQPINAVVVRRWDNRVPKGGGTVYVTNASVSDPFTVFDTYDERSVIENGIFKEGRHPWHLLRFPQRTEAAVVVHCHFTVLVMGLCTAFGLWQAKSTLGPTAQTAVHPNLSTALLGGEGTRRWRQRLREENRDTISVFIGQAYGIFHLAEFAILTHVPLRRLPSALGSPQAVLQRFGLGP